jgi:hypothetical protein
MMKWKTSIKRKAGEAHEDFIRSAIESFRSLLFELLAINLTTIVVISKHRTAVWVDIY